MFNIERLNAGVLNFSSSLRSLKIIAAISLCSLEPTAIRIISFDFPPNFSAVNITRSSESAPFFPNPGRLHDGILSTFLVSHVYPHEQCE